MKERFSDLIGFIAEGEGVSHFFGSLDNKKAARSAAFFEREAILATFHGHEELFIGFEAFQLVE